MLWSPDNRIIWNRTDSAPAGLYWVSDAPLSHGDWVVVSANSADANWAEARGFVGRDWPLLKRVAGVDGDTICRRGARIFINNRPVGVALKTDRQGRDMPVWSGCKRVGSDDVFLMNLHGSSLDGRYFGVTKPHNVDGKAVLLISAK